MSSFSPDTPPWRGSAVTPGTTGQGNRHPHGLRALAMRWLELEGCQPRIDRDGDIVFVHRAAFCLLRFDTLDPEAVRLVLPDFHPVPAAAGQAAALRAANAANMRCKVAKVHLDGDKVHATVECFLADPQQIAPTLLRCADALLYAARTFCTSYGRELER